MTSLSPLQVSQDKTLKEMGISAERLDLKGRRVLEATISGVSTTSQQLALLEGCLLVSAFPKATLAFNPNDRQRICLGASL